MKKVFTTILGIIILGFIGLILIGNEGSIEPLDGCESNEELNVYCNFMNPEDLALTPDDKFLIVAEFGGMAPLVEMTSGKLSFFSLKEKSTRIFLSVITNGVLKIALEAQMFPSVLMESI